MNPAKEIRVDTGSAIHKEPSRLPFDQVELRKIFCNELFSDPKHYSTRQ